MARIHDRLVALLEIALFTVMSMSSFCNITTEAFQTISTMPTRRPIFRPSFDSTRTPDKGPLMKHLPVRSLATDGNSEDVKNPLEELLEMWEFPTTMRATLINATFEDGTPVSKVVYVLSVRTENCDCTAFRLPKKSDAGEFAIDATNQQDNVRIALVAFVSGGGKAGDFSFSCDAVELTSTEGPRGRFTNPGGGGKHVPFLAEPTNDDDSERNRVVVRKDGGGRLEYRHDDVILEATAENLYLPDAGEALRKELEAEADRWIKNKIKWIKNKIFPN